MKTFPTTDLDLVVAVGPLIMMRAVSEMTKLYKIPTIVSLNPIMIDGTGMCGCCRVSVGDKTKFACVDGPHFDGHKLNWDLILSRRKAYMEEEIISQERHNYGKG